MPMMEDDEKMTAWLDTIGIDAVVCSGSKKNVSMWEDWMAPSASLVRASAKSGIPTLGICFGHQILSKLNGGRVKQSKHREFGLANIYKKNESLLIKNFFKGKKSIKVWMSHADQVSKLPKKFSVIASSQNSKFAIIEMGANHIGEIAKLCQISAPNYGYITNFGKAHLEGFGSAAGVVKGKCELYAFLSLKKVLALLKIMI